ncbi:MAG: hypothetical protein B6I22_08745, partial [Desulfobacteraceae bacterium 4572_123]
SEGFVKEPNSRRANFLERGVLLVRRNDNKILAQRISCVFYESFKNKKAIPTHRSGWLSPGIT